MKKKLLFASFVLGLTASAYAQSSTETSTIKPFSGYDANLFKHDITNPGNRSMLCGPDTVLYSYLKEIYNNVTPSFFLDALIPSATPRRAWSQGFELSSAATVNGIQFYGGVQDAINTAQTITVKAYLYTVDAVFQPLVKIDSATVIVGTAQTLYTANFATPVSLNTNFAVSIHNPSTTDTLDIIINNATALTYGESLAWRRFGSGTWNTALAYATQDLEPIIAPIITYNVVTDFIVSPSTTICQGTPLTFTNATTPTSIIGSRMYNYSVFTKFWGGTPDSTYLYDMGDASPFLWAKDTMYTYPAAGTYNATLYTITGLFSTCVDTKVTPIIVNPNATASYTYNAAATPTIVFTNTSTNGTTYSWDFGDGSPADNTMNPSHTYPTTGGIYTVVLTVTNSCNTITSSQVITIVATGIAVNSLNGINVYPNPSNGVFTIEMGTSSKSNIEVYNMIGELVYSQQFATATASIDLTSLNAGVYSVKVIANNSLIVKQIAITK